MARTNNLTDFLSDVADAIRTKKGTEETIQASDFDTEIASISSGANISEYFYDTLLPQGVTAYFRNAIKSVPSITIDNSITSLSSLFIDYKNLLEVKGIKFNNNVTNLTSMFERCDNLVKVDLTEGDTSNVTTMIQMFNQCYALTDVNLTNFDTKNVISLTNMFSNCTALVNLDLSSFETPKLQSTDYMFNSCKKLNYLDIRKMTFDTVTNSKKMFNQVPNNCLIIVKSDTEKTYITNNFSNLTNVKTVAELE